MPTVTISQPFMQPHHPGQLRLVLGSNIGSFYDPDSIQIERWKEYEDVLAKTTLRKEASEGKVLCEWELLGRADLEVYVWVVCKSTIPSGYQ